MDSHDVCYYRLYVSNVYSIYYGKSISLGRESGLMSKPTAPQGKHYIFRRYRKCPKTGIILDARKYHFRAWPILVDDNNPNPE